MKLRIDTATGTVSASELRGTLALEQYYPLGDSHRFIVRRVNRDTLLIQIKRDKKLVQQGIVRFLSTAAGTQANGEPVLQRYTVELHPDQPVYPMSATADALLAAGIIPSRIHPMFSQQLVHHTSSWLPDMRSDGKVERTTLTVESFTDTTDRFTISGATWAIMCSVGEIVHVFIWPGSENHIDGLMAAINEIRRGDEELESA